MMHYIHEVQSYSLWVVIGQQYSAIIPPRLAGNVAVLCKMLLFIMKEGSTHSICPRIFRGTIPSSSGVINHRALKLRRYSCKFEIDLEGDTHPNSTKVDSSEVDIEGEAANMNKDCRYHGPHDNLLRWSLMEVSENRLSQNHGFQY